MLMLESEDLLNGTKNIMRKKALITGITGQDGSYFAETLLEKGYEVHGIIRRSNSFNTGRIDHIIKDEQYKDQFFFHHGDVTDASNLNQLLETIEPETSGFNAKGENNDLIHL